MLIPVQHWRLLLRNGCAVAPALLGPARRIDKQDGLSVEGEKATAEMNVMLPSSGLKREFWGRVRVDLG